MFTLHKIKNLLTYTIVSLSFCISAVDVSAATLGGYLNSEERNCRNIEKLNKEIKKYQDMPISDISNRAEVEANKNAFIAQLQCIVDTCQQAAKFFPNSMNNLNVKESNLPSGKWYKLWLDATTEADKNKFYNKWYSEMLKELSQNANNENSKKLAANILKKQQQCNSSVDTARDTLDQSFAAGGGKACGNFPYGCAPGQKCVQTRSDNSRARGGRNATYTNDTSTTYSCMDDVPEDRNSMVAGQHKYSEVEGGDANTYHVDAMGVSNDAQVNSDGSSTHTTSIAGATVYETETNKYGEDISNEDMYSRKNNKSCNIPALKEQYLSTCYSCTIVAQMLQVFLKAASQAYSVTREAGIKLLTIGMFIWIAIYILKQISQFVQPEPMKMLQELFTFFFKCFVAYVAITSGITILTQMIINPILAVGAEFGTAVISAVGDFKFSPATGYALDASAASVLDQNTFQKMMGLSKAADNAVSINFVIGNAVTCHSTHAGAIFFAQKITDKIGIELFFPDVWLWLCGIIIWVFAFMLVIGVNFYLLDIGFKIGFVVLLLPVALGLWPFAAPFKNVFSALFKQIVNAAGIFVFLGVTTSMSMALISGALGNADKLLANISAAGSTTDEALEAQRLAEISDVFGLWSGAFILIIFAYLYSYKLISETVDKMANKFFPGDMTGNSIHTMTVQAMDWCKDKVMAVAGLVAGAVTGGASSVAQTAGKAAVKTAVKTAASTARGVGRGIGSVARKFKRGSGSNSN